MNLENEHNIITSRLQKIERCRKRIIDVYDNDPKSLEDYTKQDSIILNIQRACQACIDVSMHIVAINKWGIPQNSRDTFTLLVENNIISKGLGENLKAMVGFRNIAVHDYQTVSIKVVQKIIEIHLDDLIKFTTTIIKDEIVWKV
ncbi:MAG: hypothetical protein ATN35_02325 [Epulopiscium sp. Nele67-Bin004]|nr:MAG: hypothetical protein ATN35_02325 [Epulopiscium sp. Nele67-Bin004]